MIRHALIRFAVLLSLTLLPATQGSCTPQDFARAAAALGKVSRGAQYLGTLIEVAEAGSNLYFDRHPNPQAEPEVKQRLQQARLAQQGLAAALAAAEGVADGDIQTARTEALRAYAALRDLLSELGIPQATPPDGGAETDAPAPQPFDLPEPERVEALLTS